MLKRLVVMVALLGVPAWAETDQSNRFETEVVLGEAAAPHELVIYFSPGCRHCLEVLDAHFDDIAEGYVEDGRLRVIFREVPQIFPQRGARFGREGVQTAGLISMTLGRNLRCQLHYEGQQAFIDTMVGQLDAIRNVSLAGSVNWPYGFQTEAFHELILGMYASGLANAEQLQSCIEDPLKEPIDNVFRRHADVLYADTGAYRLPAYLLNGRRVVGETETALPDIMRALIVSVGLPAQ